MKKILLAIAFLAILGGGYYLWQNPVVDRSMEPVEETTARQEERVTGTQGIPDNAVMEDGTIDGPAVDPEFHALITFTDAGYSPSTVTIKKGQTVRFVNNSSGADTWPASAVHPTHSLYPEKTEGDCLGSAFDACRGLLPGEFWEFTFNEVGTWRYHDHLSASKTGSIVVE